MCNQCTKEYNERVIRALVTVVNEALREVKTRAQARALAITTLEVAEKAGISEEFTESSVTYTRGSARLTFVIGANGYQEQGEN